MTQWYRREEDKIIGKIDNKRKQTTKEIHKKKHKQRKSKPITQGANY